jgi:hypothetical protein
MTVERTNSELDRARKKINRLITMGIISSNITLFAMLYFMKMPYISTISVAIAAAVTVSILEVVFIRTTLAKKQKIN